MSLQRKTYRFRMEPTKAQESILVRMAGARRFVWNWGLRRWNEHYAATGKSIGVSRLCVELTALKQQPETAWLKEINASSLQQPLRDLQRSFVDFFKKRARHPKFKCRKRDPLRFRIPQCARVKGGKVYVPKAGLIRIRQSREITETTKSATFRRHPDGHWYVSLVVEFEMPDVALPTPDPAKVVGIDLGLKDFIVRSDGECIPSPRFYRKGERRLRKAQRRLSRSEPRSNRRTKAKMKVARIYQKIADQRRDFLHKLTTEVVVRHDGLCIEDLNIKALARTKLGKSFTDASMGEFRRQLTYKSEWNRKHLIVVDRFFPSSRLCWKCGEINHELTLADREWTCVCGMVHDRDLSASINIRDEGLRMLAVGHTDNPNARGRSVRLPTGSSFG